MSKENHYIFSSPPSPFSVYLTDEEYNDEIEEYSEEVSSSDESFRPSNFKCEVFSELFNEMLTLTDEYDTSNVDSESVYSEDSENNILDQESNDETFEKNEIIDDIEQTKFTPCVIIDVIGGKFQRCGGMGKLRQLRNLFGTWQVDRDAIKEVDGVLSKLGVCDSHFQFDNKYLHKNKSQHKQTKEFNEGIIQWRRCISCNKYVTFFSRGVGCIIHSWYLNKKNIQVPCIGQYTCEAL